MNVILIFTFGVSLKEWLNTGLLNRELALYREISKLEDISYTFITFGDDSDFLIIDHPNIKVLPAYTYLKKSKYKSLNYLKSLFLPFLIRKDLKNHDIIKTNQLSGSWIGIILKFLLDVPLYIRTGYNIYEFKTLQNKSLFVRYFYLLLTKLSYFFAEIFTVTSLTDKENISNICKDSKKLSLLRNYVVKIDFKEYEKRESLKILSVGRLDRQKNFRSMIQIFNNSKFQLDIIGDGPDKASLKKFSVEKNCNLNLLGSINNEEVMSIYKNYKFFFSTSKYEGNPKALIEAMAMGCLVFTTKNKNSEEIIEHEKNGYFIEHTENILNTLENLINKPEKAKEIIENGYELIKKEYLIKNIVNAEINIYKNLIT